MRDKKNSEKPNLHTEAEPEDNGRADGEQDESLLTAETLENVEEIYAEFVKEAAKMVRKRPVESLAVTFGVGCLVGLLLSRR